jgi:hypothetical protein
MEIAPIFNLALGLIILLLTLLTLYFPIVIYLNLRKYKEASLGLIFSNLESSIIAFKFLGLAVLIFAIGRIIDLLNLISFSSSVDILATLLYLVTDILLIYAFYKLLIIIRIRNSMDKELNKKIN